MPDDWELMAAWYDAKQGDDGDLWHRTLIDPSLLEVLGDVRGLRVLDVGCGNGYLARRAARAGAAAVTGIDQTSAIIERARGHEAQAPLGVRYLVTDAAFMSELEAGSFDVAFSNMALMDMPRADAAMAEVARVLVPGGRFVFSISHPCFDIGSRSSWVTEHRGRDRAISRRVEKYREPTSESFPWYGPNGEVWHTTGYHRPLSWYFRELARLGFRVERFEEPAPSDEFVRSATEGPYIVEIPLHCVVAAVRPG